MTEEPPQAPAADHYAWHARHDSVVDAVMRELPQGAPIRPSDLAALDQFHVRGLEASDELAGLAGLVPGLRVLDVGSGIGGPARHLAAAYGCAVTGIDLTAEYVRIAETLTARAGLSGTVRFETGDALDLPFAAGTFDVVWTQHAAMNIADRARLYAEMHRVLAPGGTLATYDVVAGEPGPEHGGTVHFPVPWARDPAGSHMVSPSAMRDLIEQAGFRVEVWRDTTPAAKAWFAAPRSAPRPLTPPSLGLHLLLGPDFPTMSANLARNVEEGRVGLIMAVARKTALQAG